MEEFHGDSSVTPWIFQLLYGWNSINTNVWLPSLMELVGHDPNQYWEARGTYYSAMQELNTSNNYYVDARGGTQWAYMKQYNASGGGQKIWEACNREITRLRSAYYGSSMAAWRIMSAIEVNAPSVTVPHAVHPAVEYNPKRRVTQK